MPKLVGTLSLIVTICNLVTGVLYFLAGNSGLGFFYIAIAMAWLALAVFWFTSD